MPVTQARAKICELLDCAAFTREPIQITVRRGNAVLPSEEEWRNRNALSVTGMPDSI